MNRRARQAAIAKQNKFVDDYVRHLPEVGPEVLSQPGVTHMVCLVPDLINPDRNWRGVYI
jgi:hypothetical protein